MKKKIGLLSVIGALLLCAVCTLAFAACGVSMPKGGMVTEEGWRSAIENTSEVSNYILNMSLSLEFEMEGDVWERDYSSSDYNGKIRKAVKGDHYQSGTMTVLFDKDNKFYGESESVNKTNIEEDGEKEFDNRKVMRKEYYERGRKEDDLQYYWRARSESENSETTDGRRNSETYWSASETYSFMSNSISSMFNDTNFYETKDSERSKKIIDLYDKFAYADGIYTAKLYRRVSIHNSIYENVGCIVSVSFDKTENCVIGIGIKTNGADNMWKYDEYDLAYSYKGESIYRISNIGNTDVSVKENNDIRSAVNKAKAKNDR